jgi:TP901-1 family phage major tail protein
MPEIAGKDLLIYANTGTEATPVWTKVGAQRGFTLEETADNFETTSKDSGKNREYEYSYNSSTVSLNGVYIPSDAGLTALKDAQRTHTKILIQTYEEGVAVEEANALVTSRTIEGPHDDVGTYSVELQISGGWTAAA